MSNAVAFEQDRRAFLLRLGAGLGWLSAAEILGLPAWAQTGGEAFSRGTLTSPHLPPTAKRVIYLHMLGAISQVDTFDYKPTLERMHGEELPASVRGTARVSAMVAGQSSFPIVAPLAKFRPGGQSGTMVSDLMPFVRDIVDDISIVRTVHTEHVNHDPASKFLHTGFQIAGRPSGGAWVNYAIGSGNRDLPAFVVLSSGVPGGVPLDAAAWGAGFLPSHYQGVLFRNEAVPVPYVESVRGVTPDDRQSMLDVISALSAEEHAASNDPEILSRVSQYEMAYRMHQSVPEVADVSDEPDHVLRLYGPNVMQPGTFARNCLLARRLAERDVRYTMVVQMGWDHHSGIAQDHPRLCAQVDQPAAALVTDLKQRGLLNDTLVVFATEFGRTAFAQGTLRSNFGRDHHGGCFSVWLAGGGVKAGTTYGETDEFCYNIAKNPVHVHDLNATILRTLGIDHTRLTFKAQGRDFRLTDVAGRVITAVLS